MPEEVLALLIVISIMTFIVTILKSTQNYRLKKIERETGGNTTADKSLTTTELEELIKDAVVDATAPLEDQIKILASRVDELDGGSGGSLLEGEYEEPSKTLGRQTRQRQR